MIVLARFKHHYPGEYRSDEYRTREHVIPFGLFWLHYAAMTHNLAVERVNQSRAISHALAQAFAKDDGKAARFTESELAEAFLGPPPS